MTQTSADRAATPAIRLRRLVRHWALVFLIAIGFLLMALLIDETDRTVTPQSLPAVPSALIPA